MEQSLMRVVRLAPGEPLGPEHLARNGSVPASALQAAAEIVAAVRERGDNAVRELSERFDGFCATPFRVPQAIIDQARERVGHELLTALEHAADQIRDFHERQALESWSFARPNGTRLGILVHPLASVGIYVPGGRARYPSTVLMNAIPAKVAGVGRIVMVTPPQSDGTLSAALLAAASVAGVDEVHAIGGAQAIAALAYGTASIPRVDKVCGPGNAYVAAAKRLVAGDVGIDMVAGPSEVCVLQDLACDTDPLVIAADLAAQAEHDPDAACYLVVYGDEGEGSAEDLVARVRDALERIVAASPRGDITRASLALHGLIVLCASEDDALGAVGAIAPEHLEIHSRHPWDLAQRVRAAGAMFLGEWSSEPLGDYVAGPNHTLPTGGTARFNGPLSTSDFQTYSSVVDYTESGVLQDVPATQVLACSEGLWAHGLSAGLRLAQATGAMPGPADALGPLAWPEAVEGATATVSLTGGA